MKRIILMCILCFFVAFQANLNAQSLELFEKNVTEHTLNNGLKIIVVQRDVAPVASFMTFVKAGGVNEPVGQGGVAHIFEHMAFKGSTRIGTNNWEAEKPLLEEIDATYSRWLREARSSNPNEARTDSLLNRFKELEEEAKQYVVSNEFSQIIEREGGVGLNAGTGYDFTVYFYSLPQNKAELWFSLEAERFIDPVMREFYVEKDVIFEERRMRTDSNPIGRLTEEFLSVAYSALQYRDALIGWPSDIESVTIADALTFYDDFYVPSNMFIVVVGDVDPNQMIEYAETYFGGMPGGKEAPGMFVEEPRQRGERRFVIEDQSQPVLMMGYKTVASSHPDALILDLLSGILYEGRTSRMVKKIVEEDKLALAVQGVNGYPSDKYTSMLLTFAVPNQDVSLEDLEAAVQTELDKVMTELVTEEELQSIVTRRRASVLRQLGNNDGIGFLLAQTYGNTGDWRSVFTDLERMQEIRPEDIMRVANQYLDKTQRTVGKIVNKPAENQ
jgi:predicted Zn-dependent peptidase